MSDYLPPGLVTEILYWLPVDSLLRFRCVSKEWCSIISSPNFISTHLSYSLSATQPPLLVLRHSTKRQEQHYSLYHLEPSNELTVVKKLNIPFKRCMNGNPFRAVGFCNGLFCLINDLNGYTYTIILWNPAIRKSLLLHKPRPRLPLRDLPLNEYFHGFGFDSKTRDFKVVRIAYSGVTHRAFEVEVYSLSGSLWKKMNSKDIPCGRVIQNYRCSTIYLNGTIHWVCYTVSVSEAGNHYTNSLLCFDLSNDTFSELDLPRELFRVDPCCLLVTLCGEQISVVCRDKGHNDRGEPVDRCVVWVMNLYGEPDSWTQKFVVVSEDIILPLGFRGTGEFLFRRSGGSPVSYDPESEEFKDVGEGEPFFSNKYVESLALLEGGSGATADPDPSECASDDEPPDYWNTEN